MAAAAVVESNAAGNGSVRMITLVSSDGERFQLLEAAASVAGTLRRMIKDGCVTDADGITLPSVAAKPLAKIVEYCSKHAAADAGEKPTREWDDELIGVGQALLHDVLLAANHLEIEGLVELASKRVADMLKGKPPAEIRRMLGIEYDFTPEQREEILRDNSWI